MAEKRYVNPYRLFTGIFIPEALVTVREISPGSKFCYGRLCRYAGQNGQCFPFQSTLAEELGVSDRTIRTYITELEEFGLIEQHQQGLGKPNIIKFLDHYLFTSDGQNVQRKETSGQTGNLLPNLRKETSGPYKEEESHIRESYEESTPLSPIIEDLKSTPKSTPLVIEKLQGCEQTPTPPLPPASPLAESSADSAFTARMMVTRFKSLKDGKLNKAGRDLIAAKCESCGLDSNQLLASWEKFTADEFWRDFAPLHRVRAFFKFATEDGMGEFSRNTGRPAIKRVPEDVLPPTAGDMGLKSPPIEIPLEAETWNRLVTNGKPVTKWNPRYDPDKMLQMYRRDAEFRDGFERVCNSAQKIIAAGGDWLTFKWLLDSGPKGIGWYRIMEGDFDFLLNPKRNGGKKLSAAEEQLAEIRRELEAGQ